MFYLDIWKVWLKVHGEHGFVEEKFDPEWPSFDIVQLFPPKVHFFQRRFPAFLGQWLHVMSESLISASILG